MATMASHLLALLLLCAVACGTPTIQAQRGEPNTNTSLPAPLVRSTCNATAHYDLCVATLVADPVSSTADLRGLCAIAVSAAAADASATQAALANTTSSDDGVLIRACAAKYSEARDALVDAQVAVGQELYDYASVSLSAAAEYPAVCRTLFRTRRGAYPKDLARREMALERMCTVANDIITLLLS